MKNPLEAATGRTVRAAQFPERRYVDGCLERSGGLGAIRGERETMRRGPQPWPGALLMTLALGAIGGGRSEELVAHWEWGTGPDNPYEQPVTTAEWGFECVDPDLARCLRWVRGCLALVPGRASTPPTRQPPGPTACGSRRTSTTSVASRTARLSRVQRDRARAARPPRPAHPGDFPGVSGTSRAGRTRGGVIGEIEVEGPVPSSSARDRGRARAVRLGPTRRVETARTASSPASVRVRHAVRGQRCGTPTGAK